MFGAQRHRNRNFPSLGALPPALKKNVPPVKHFYDGFYELLKVWKEYNFGSRSLPSNKQMISQDTLLEKFFLPVDVQLFPYSNPVTAYTPAPSGSGIGGFDPFAWYQNVGWRTAELIFRPEYRVWNENVDTDSWLFAPTGHDNDHERVLHDEPLWLPLQTIPNPDFEDIYLSKPKVNIPSTGQGEEFNISIETVDIPYSIPYDSNFIGIGGYNFTRHIVIIVEEVATGIKMKAWINVSPTYYGGVYSKNPPEPALTINKWWNLKQALQTGVYSGGTVSGRVELMLNRPSSSEGNAENADWSRWKRNQTSDKSGQFYTQLGWVFEFYDAEGNILITDLPETQQEDPGTPGTPKQELFNCLTDETLESLEEVIARHGQVIKKDKQYRDAVNYQEVYFMADGTIWMQTGIARPYYCKVGETEPERPSALVTNTDCNCQVVQTEKKMWVSRVKITNNDVPFVGKRMRVECDTSNQQQRYTINCDEETQKIVDNLNRGN